MSDCEGRFVSPPVFAPKVPRRGANFGELHNGKLLVSKRKAIHTDHIVLSAG